MNNKTGVDVQLLIATAQYIYIYIYIHSSEEIYFIFTGLLQSFISSIRQRRIWCFDSGGMDFYAKGEHKVRYFIIKKLLISMRS